MAEYSGDAEKLRNWLQQNSSTGNINDIPVIADGYTEVNGWVHERDYNDALKYAAPWAGKKAFVAEHGIVAIASRTPVLTHSEIISLPTYTKEQPESRLFRGRVSQGTLDILRKELADYNLNASQQATVVLRYFIADCTIIRVYQRWLREWMQMTGLKQDEVETIVYNFYRVDGARKRLVLLEAGDPDANSPKML